MHALQANATLYTTSENDQSMYMFGGMISYDAYNAKNDKGGMRVYPEDGVFTAPQDGVYMFIFRGSKVGTPNTLLL